MEWIDQFQQALGRPVLAFAREYWVYLLIALTVAMLWYFGRPGRYASSGGTDFTTGDADGDGGGGDGGGGD